MSGSTLIGTSGWSYGHWSGDFYPRGLPAREWFGYYAEQFRTVEINNTFYRLPSQSAVQRWRRQAPPGFRFAVKGSRYITHIKRLREPRDPVARLSSLMGSLGETLAVFLWQLPPQMKPDPARLESFLVNLPTTVRHAIEFRHSSWLSDDVFAILRRHNTAHVNVSSDAMPVNMTTTADFVYVRLHGLATQHGAYPQPALEPWARFLAEQQAVGRDAFVYFNNDMGGHAPRDALRLASMLKPSQGR